jgi:hypothetical protein
MTASFPDVTTVAKAERHQARTEITCKIDGVTCFPSKTSTDTEDDEEEA